MENQKTIIIVLGIIVAILVVAVIMVSPLMVKEGCSLTINDNSIKAGDSLIVSLEDGKGNAISNRTINVKLTDKDGLEITKDVVTNSKGKAKLKVEDVGKYSAECTFAGDEKFSSASLSDNVTVKAAKTKLVSEEQTSTATHSSKYAPDGGIYPEYGPEVDSQGITREEAIAKDMHYLELNIDGKAVGGYTAYDPAAGCYHT